MSSNVDKNQTTRRTVINWLLGGGVILWLGGIIYSVIQYLIPPESPDVDLKAVLLGNTDELKSNSSKMFKFGRKPAIAIRLENGTVKAYIAKCTHLGCIVEYVSDQKIFFCNCHGGKYDINGKNISGPPPSPLPELLVTEKDGKIFVSERSV